MTLQDLINKARQTIGDPRMSDSMVVNTVTACIEQEIGDEPLADQLQEFDRCYESWLEYQEEMTREYLSIYG